MTHDPYKLWIKELQDNEIKMMTCLRERTDIISAYGKWSKLTRDWRYSPIGALCEAYIKRTTERRRSRAQWSWNGSHFEWWDAAGRRHQVGSALNPPAPVKKWWWDWYRGKSLYALKPFLRDSELTGEAFTTLLITGAIWV